MEIPDSGSGEGGGGSRGQPGRGGGDGTGNPLWTSPNHCCGILSGPSPEPSQSSINEDDYQ